MRRTKVIVAAAGMLAAAGVMSVTAARLAAQNRAAAPAGSGAVQCGAWNGLPGRHTMPG